MAAVLSWSRLDRDGRQEQHDGGEDDEQLSPTHESPCPTDLVSIPRLAARSTRIRGNIPLARARGGALGSRGGRLGPRWIAIRSFGALLSPQQRMRLMPPAPGRRSVPEPPPREFETRKSEPDFDTCRAICILRRRTSTREIEMKRPFALRLATFATVVVGLLFAAPAAVASQGPSLDESSIHPMVFVHGSTGSGAQFASQKMRFTENGYPDDYVRIFEYDSTFSLESPADVQARLDKLHRPGEAADGPKPGRPPRPLAGTAVSQTYLNASPAHAANIAHYVNIDGAQAASPPGGVPTRPSGREGHAGSVDRRGDQRHGPQPDARPVGDLSRIVR